MALLKQKKITGWFSGMLIRYGNLFVIALIFAPRLYAQPVAGEYELKAVFLFNFAQFVEWPASAFSGNESPLIIGVLGTDPFGNYLNEVVKGEKIGMRPLEVRRFLPGEQIDSCHVLYISKSEQSTLSSVLEMLRTRPILTVGEAEDFTLHGGMIQFVSVGHNIRLKINLHTARQHMVEISSKLLSSRVVLSVETGEFSK